MPSAYHLVIDPFERMDKSSMENGKVDLPGIGRISRHKHEMTPRVSPRSQQWRTAWPTRSRTLSCLDIDRRMIGRSVSRHSGSPDWNDLGTVGRAIHSDPLQRGQGQQSGRPSISELPAGAQRCPPRRRTSQRLPRRLSLTRPSASKM